jgi:hypothetical protein
MVGSMSKFTGCIITIITFHVFDISQQPTGNTSQQHAPSLVIDILFDIYKHLKP